jgi:hypothetical protein
MRFRSILTALSLLLCGGCLQNHELFREVDAAGAGATEPVKSAIGQACARDEDCVSASWCANQLCTACPTATRCRDNFSAVKRNDCTWCAPNNECLANSECGGDEVCYAGLQCTPGCQNDPTCCYGNLCGDPSCGPPTSLDCSKVGCADGGSCLGTASFDECECDEVTHVWGCAMSSGSNQCQLDQ